MSAPTCSASLNKATYAPGETMTLTVNYGDPDRRTDTVTITVTDSTGLTGTASTTLVMDPLTLAVSDSSGRVWAKQSDTGSVAVYTAVA